MIKLQRVFLVIALLFLTITGASATRYGNTVTILSAATAPTIGTPFTSITGSTGTYIPDIITVQCTTTGTGAVTSTVLVQGSNNNTNWITLYTLTISGTTVDTQGVTSNSPWRWTRANQTAITGTAAATTCIAGD